MLWPNQNKFRIVKVLNDPLVSVIYCCFTSDTLGNTLVMSRMSLELDSLLSRRHTNKQVLIFGLAMPEFLIAKGKG